MFVSSLTSVYCIQDTTERNRFISSVTSVYCIQDTTERNRLMLYWKHLLAIVVGSFCLLLFELCER